MNRLGKEIRIKLERNLFNKISSQSNIAYDVWHRLYLSVGEHIRDSGLMISPFV
jgi:hypothetical protein